MSVLLQINLPHLCAGIEVESMRSEARITRVAPIFGWALGRRFAVIKKWVSRRHGSMVIVTEECVKL